MQGFLGGNFSCGKLSGGIVLVPGESDFKSGQTRLQTFWKSLFTRVWKEVFGRAIFVTLFLIPKKTRAREHHGKA